MRSLLATAILAVVVLTGIAHADGTVAHRRVVLVAMPDTVFSATAAALGPWSIAVEATSDPMPVDDAAAAAIAHVHDATAVAWLDAGELVIYDHLRKASERRAAQPPVDDVTAAAIALSIKTALRRPVEIVRLPAIVEVPRPPTFVEAPPPVIVEPPAERRVHLAAHLGLGVPMDASAQSLLRADARVSVDLPWIADLSVVGVIGGGVMSSIETADFSGDYRELVLGVGAQWRRPLRHGLCLMPFGQLNLHASRLRGTLSEDRMATSSQTTPALELGLGVDRRVGPLRIGGLATAEVLLSPTRYQVQTVDVLVVPRFGLGFALRVAF